jgi:hypothetical protein
MGAYEVDYTETTAELIDELSCYVSCLPLTDEQREELEGRLFDLLHAVEHDAFSCGMEMK